MLVGTEAEVLDGLTGVLGATEQQGVGTGGLLQGELVESLGSAASSQDTGTGSSGETQGSDVHLGNLEQTGVIGDGADNDDGLLLVAVLDVGVDAGERHGRSVHAGHEQTAQHDLVEGRVGTAYPIEIEGQQLPQVSALGVNLLDKTYGPGSGTASPRASGRHCRSWAPCGGCCARGGGRDRYL